MYRKVFQNVFFIHPFMCFASFLLLPFNLYCPSFCFVSFIFHFLLYCFIIFFLFHMCNNWCSHQVMIFVSFHLSHVTLKKNSLCILHYNNVKIDFLCCCFFKDGSIMRWVCMYKTKMVIIFINDIDYDFKWLIYIM